MVLNFSTCREEEVDSNWWAADKRWQTLLKESHTLKPQRLKNRQEIRSKRKKEGRTIQRAKPKPLSRSFAEVWAKRSKFLRGAEGIFSANQPTKQPFNQLTDQPINHTKEIMKKILPFCLFFCMLLQATTSKPKKESSIPETAGYINFRKQHMDQGMTKEKCKKLNTKNYGKTNDCKEKNTFITDSPKDVKSICNDGGDYDSKTGLTVSKKGFNIVDCTLKQMEAKKPHCEYRGNTFTQRLLVVRCQDGLPVHFERSIQLPKVFNY
ncbi:PREDICTED: angiogenin [Cyprinodon variegatus]|uniref:angiogenin n=1 Tax=Cyprinodon variegatus TaxID=28743 RepID=UPI0007425931|nr:PREDICTED: angiogenin [Cyprinodon variegatus]